MSITLVTVDGTHQLAAGAAASYGAMLAAGCPLGCITSAYRSPAEQEALFRSRYTTTPVAHVAPVMWMGRRWYKRPGVPTAAVPGTSKHEQGIALDLAEPARSWVAIHGAPFGWLRPRKPDGSFAIPSEPWHSEFTGYTPPPPDERTPDMEVRIIRADGPKGSPPIKFMAFGPTGVSIEIGAAGWAVMAIQHPEMNVDSRYHVTQAEYDTELGFVRATAGVVDVDEVALAKALAPFITGATKADLTAAVAAIKAVIPTKATLTP